MTNLRLRAVAGWLQPEPATLLAWLIPIFAWAPLAYPGYFQFNSGFSPVFNLEDLLRNPPLGWLPPFAPSYDLLRGQGPLPYFLAVLLRPFAGTSAGSLLALFGLAILAGGLGVYAWARRHLGSWPALVAAAAYLACPLLLATVFVRGAVAEALLLALLPWSLWGIERAAAGRTFGLAVAALAVACMVWTQPGLALWASLILLVYLLILGKNEPRRVRGLLAWAAGLAAGILGLLPALLRHGAGGWTPVVFADHLVYPSQLLQGSGAGMSIAGPGDTLPFSVGAITFALAALTLIGGDDREGSAGNNPGAPTHRFALVAALILLVLASTPSGFVWRLLPFLARPLTYPWQMLLLALPWLALLAGRGAGRVIALLPAPGPARSTAPLAVALVALPLLASYPIVQPVTWPEAIPPAPLGVYGRGEIALLDVKVTGAPAAGGLVVLTAHWQGMRPLDRDYTVFVHAVGPDGQRWGQQDTMPLNGRLPTSRWVTGQVVQDRYEIALAPDAPPGPGYTLHIGFYLLADGVRLRTAAGDDKVVILP